MSETRMRTIDGIAWCPAAPRRPPAPLVVVLASGAVAARLPEGAAVSNRNDLDRQIRYLSVAVICLAIATVAYVVVTVMHVTGRL